MYKRSRRVFMRYVTCPEPRRIRCMRTFPATSSVPSFYRPQVGKSLLPLTSQRYVYISAAGSPILWFCRPRLLLTTSFTLSTRARSKRLNTIRRTDSLVWRSSGSLVPPHDNDADAPVGPSPVSATNYTHERRKALWHRSQSLKFGGWH